MNSQARFTEADKAWSEELRIVFGKNSGDARYDHRGTSTPELKRLEQERRTAQKEWFAECDKNRIYK
jgi:hypothetical protein